MLSVAVFVPLVVPVLMSRLVGFKEHVIWAVAELGEHVRFTVPVKPFSAVIVIVDVPVPPAAATVEFAPLIEKSVEGVTPIHAVIRLATFNEPSPVV